MAIDYIIGNCFGNRLILIKSLMRNITYSLETDQVSDCTVVVENYRSEKIKEKKNVKFDWYLIKLVKNIFYSL